MFHTRLEELINNLEHSQKENQELRNEIYLIRDIMFEFRQWKDKPSEEWMVKSCNRLEKLFKAHDERVMKYLNLEKKEERREEKLP